MRTLRRHQAEFKRIIDRIVAGESIRDILACITPGGGKSLLVPLGANGLMRADMADFFCWVAPRLSLADQAHDVFLRPDELFNPLKLRIRHATNDFNPCRNAHGFVTINKAVEVDDARTVREMFASKRGILFIDECHHMFVGSKLHKMIQEFADLAVLRVYMSGNLTRGDKKRVAGIPYLEDGTPDFEKPGWGVVRYGRRQAILDHAKIPIVFAHFDGAARWLDMAGQKQEVSSLRTGEKARDAVFAAIQTSYADGLLMECLGHFSDHKKHANPRAKCLVVACSIKEANRQYKIVRELGFRAAIAVCKLNGEGYSEHSRKSIKRFKEHGPTSVDVLITVQMAYEGLDVPSITHLVCLTHIRSWPWIEQMFDRGTRYDSDAGPWESQRLYAWVPDDPLMRDAIARIKAEEPDPASDAKPEADDSEKSSTRTQDGELPPAPEEEQPRIIPLAGAVSEIRYVGDHGEEPVQVSPSMGRKITTAMRAHGIIGSPLDYVMSLKDMGISLPASVLEAKGDEPSSFILGEITENEEEKILRSQIQTRCGAFDRQQGWAYGTSNGKVKKAFGKGRDEMDLAELRQAWAWINLYFQIREAQ